MTLIAAICCENGIVVCADSEENYGATRKSVRKLAPVRMGNFDVVVGGAGVGDLIDSFTIKLQDSLDRNPLNDLTAFRALAESELATFYESDVATYPEQDKRIKLIIAARSINSGEFMAWVTKHTTLARIATYELAGIEDALYDSVVKRIYRPDMTLSQAVMCGSYLFTVATETSTYVRGETSVAIINEEGAFLESPGHIKLINERLQEYEKHVNAIFMLCADTSVAPSRLAEELADFSSTVLDLHKTHIETVVSSGFAAVNTNVNRPLYSQTPQLLIFLPKDAVIDDQLKEKMRAAITEQYGIPVSVAEVMEFFKVFKDQEAEIAPTPSDPQTSGPPSKSR